MFPILELFKQIPHPKDVNDYYHCYNSSNILNVLYWWKFFEMTADIEGDIVECGVGRGRSLISILSLNRFIETSNEKTYSRKVFALDSFEGFPEPTELDISPRNPKKGEWSSSPNNQFEYSVETLHRVLTCADLGGLRENKLELVKGFFDETTHSLQVEKISILHLDGDLYESVLTPLENLWAKISIGGIVIIDDYIADKKYDHNKFPGARKAIEKFLDTNNCFECKVSIKGAPYLIRTR